MAKKTPKAGLTGSFNPNAKQPSQEEVNDFNFAARVGDVAALEKFLKEYPGAIDDKADNGMTSLMVAAANGEKRAVRLLLESGANPDEKTKHGRSALQYSDREGQREISAMIRQASREWKQAQAAKAPQIAAQEVDGFNFAARIGDDAAVGKFLEANPGLIDVKASNGLTALMVAAANGNRSTVRLLLNNGANPDEKTTFGRSAVQYADREGQREISAMIKEASQERAKEAEAAKKGRGPAPG